MIYLDIKSNDSRAPGRLLVKIPKEIKEEFKKRFSGEYVWHAKDSAWSVPLDAEGRLKKWVELARPIVEVSREATTLYFTELEISEIQLEIAEATEKLKRLNSEKGNLSIRRNILHDSAQAIKELKEDIAATESAIKFAHQHAAAFETQIMATLERLEISLPELYKDYNILELFEASSSRTQQEDWRQAQLKFIRARNTLASAGLELEAISYLAEYRGPIRKMPLTAWHTMKKLS